MSKTRVWTMRVVFALAILLIPAEVLVQRSLGQQPYPAIYQPDFRGVPLAKDGTIRVSDLSVLVQFENEPEIDFDWRQLVPMTPLSEKAVLRTAYGTQAAADEADSRAYLQTRMAELYPDKKALSLTFLWQSSLQDLDGDEVSPVQVDRRVAVDLG